MDYKPLSREFLLQRGCCCGNNCLNCPYKDNNMKTKKQYKDSMMNFIIGGIGVTLIVILVLVLNSTEPQHQPNIDKYEWNQGECGDTSTLQDSLELIEFDTIYYDTLIYNMLDITNINKETKVWTGTTQGVDTSYPDDYGNKKQK